ncbi:hypothetical protein CEXT_583471 [Caerostris extrusa]|uniref:Uncharacterized protein n=1 Tax=Caerostris extrusa TaxID=172846 RepID=A0AAV4R8N9_CAEEX|nr:hypothetical protein CEXT_583471 [Caerostris extrusa]
MAGVIIGQKFVTDIVMVGDNDTFVYLSEQRIVSKNANNGFRVASPETKALCRNGHPRYPSLRVIFRFTNENKQSMVCRPTHNTTWNNIGKITLSKKNFEQMKSGSLTQEIAND